MTYALLTMLTLGTNSAAAQGLEGLNFAVINPNGWNERATAENMVNELTPNQTIEYGVVQDPYDANSVYFATSAPVTTENNRNGVLLSVYHYNVAANTYERLWRDAFDPGEIGGLGANALPEWNVIGYDNGRVVYLQQQAGYVGPNCSQSVLIGVDHTDGASLASVPGDNLQVAADGSLYRKEVPAAYAPPQELINQARSMQQQCSGQQ